MKDYLREFHCSVSAENTRLDRRTAHEGQVGTGLADGPETGDDFFVLEYIPWAFSIGRGFDGQVGFPVSIVAVQEIAGGPVYDGKKAGAQDGGAAMLACFDQERNFQCSGRAPDPADRAERGADRQG